jgi:tetratricopeptide (TPR) repeat protein
LLITEGESPLRAKKLLEQVLRVPQTPELKSRAHHWLGYLLLSQDEGDMGEGHFLEALQLNPKDAAARFNLGRAYLKQEKFSQALDYLQLAELEMPNLWLIHIYKGWARMALGNKEEAKSSFKTAIQASKDRWMTYIYYSIFLLRFEEYDEAKATLKQMLTYDPNYELNSPPPMEYFQSKVNYNDYLTAYNKVMEKGTSDEREMGQLEEIGSGW